MVKLHPEDVGAVKGGLTEADIAAGRLWSAKVAIMAGMRPTYQPSDMLFPACPMSLP